MTNVMCNHWKKTYFGTPSSFDYVFMETHQTNENYVNINLAQIITKKIHLMGSKWNLLNQKVSLKFDVYVFYGGSIFEKTRIHKSSFYNVNFLKFYGTMGPMVIKFMYQK